MRGSSQSTKELLANLKFEYLPKPRWDLEALFAIPEIAGLLNFKARPLGGKFEAKSCPSNSENRWLGPASLKLFFGL
ncbi:predicted protein [Plenodomus lingam JN3]|uniref:Uncharacterized protein n=1 Tax=Leptosphaeria maculans (strain JN3 / isolate v23.1.3 / race Av1-4-5-6-7-8) TaxID=985895 RepID=M1ZME3_LEPMJ|nr:predicted protein [Plenodomus lingam JN3]